MKPATKFARHSSDKGNATLSSLGCPLCGSEMNLEATVRTVYGATYGPYVGVQVRLQCQKQECRYYERTTASAHDDTSLKAVERAGMEFLSKVPSMAHWKKTRVTAAKYQYRPRK